MTFSRFWDVSMSLIQGMSVWPGDTAFTRTVRTEIKGEQVWSNSDLHMGCHTGTHMDAPRHVFQKAGDVNTVPLAILIGQCRVVLIDGPVIDREAIARIAPESGERILFKTFNSEADDNGSFNETYVHFDKAAAEALVEAQVVLVGTDGPSVDAFGQDDCYAHLAFCDAGIALVENLVLREVEPGDYTLICLPMKLEGSDGAPVRAILAR